MTNHLFLASSRKVGVAVEHIFDNAVHLCKEIPLLSLLLIGSLYKVGVLIPAFFAVLSNPCSALCNFFSIVDAFGHSADDFHFVDGLYTHAEIVFNKVGVDLRAGNAHAKRADL